MGRRRIRRRKPSFESPRVVAGAAWYTREQWEKLKAVAADPDILEDSHDDWYRMATTALTKIRSAGQEIEPVEIDVDELIAWCRETGRPIDAAARSQFAAELLRRRDNPELDAAPE